MLEWILPNEKDIKENVDIEPEGERIRSEFIEFLERNKIVGIMMDTPEHSIEIVYQPRLPPNIKPVLTRWGSIYVKDEE